MHHTFLLPGFLRCYDSLPEKQHMRIPASHRLEVVSSYVPAHTGVFASHTFLEKKISFVKQVCV